LSDPDWFVRTCVHTLSDPDWFVRTCVHTLSDPARVGSVLTSVQGAVTCRPDCIGVPALPNVTGMHVSLAPMTVAEVAAVATAPASAATMKVRPDAVRVSSPFEVSAVTSATGVMVARMSRTMIVPMP
jgi:hypothetical protein